MSRTATYETLKATPNEAGTERSQPNLHQQAREIQPFNKIT